MGRIFILRLQEGERIPEVIETFAEQHDLTTGLCFFLGGAKETSRIVVGPKEAYTFPLTQ
jgi:predicted DNA-binding protein with PD1-like motif